MSKHRQKRRSAKRARRLLGVREFCREVGCQLHTGRKLFEAAQANFGEFAGLVAKRPGTTPAIDIEEFARRFASRKPPKRRISW